MGAGILGIPLVFRSYGIIIASILLFLFASVTCYSVKLLLYTHKLSGKTGYSMFSKICYGNNGNLFVKLVIILNNFGITCAYFRIFGTVIHGVVDSFLTPETSQTNFFGNNWHQWFYIVILALCMLPLIFKNKIDALKVILFLIFNLFIIFSITK